jgi:hypothetical protein
MILLKDGSMDDVFFFIAINLDSSEKKLMDFTNLGHLGENKNKYYGL